MWSFCCDHVWLWRNSFQIKKQSRKEKTEQEIKWVGEARVLCEEQMVNGCKHTSMIISREAPLRDISISLLTIHSLLEIVLPTVFIRLFFYSFITSKFLSYTKAVSL